MMKDKNGQLLNSKITSENYYMREMQLIVEIQRDSIFFLKSEFNSIIFLLFEEEKNECLNKL